MASGAKKDNDLSTMLKIVPMIKEVGYDEWLKKIQLVAYQYDWYNEDDFDEDNEWDPTQFAPVNGGNLSAADKRAKKVCFTLIFNTLKGHEHLLTSIAMGDTVAAFKAVTTYFQRDTAAGAVDASSAFTTSSMMKDHVSISEFVALVSKRAKKVIKSGGSANEVDKLSTLLKGLLPEFKEVKTIIMMQPMNTLVYSDVAAHLFDYAQTNGIDSLKQGGSKDKVFLAEEQSEIPACRNFARHGSCSFGEKCKFDHGGGQSKSKQQHQSKPTHQKRHCNYCGKDTHNEDRCFKKKSDERSNGGPATRSKRDRSEYEGGVENAAFVAKAVKMYKKSLASKSARRGKRSDTDSDGSDSDSGAHTFMMMADAPKLQAKNGAYVNAAYYHSDKSSTWISDCGSNRFTTNDETDFIKGTTEESNIKVEIGAGHVMCTKTGDVRVKDEKTGSQLLLTTVLFLPNCGRKLISESKLDKGGCSVVKPGNGTCKVTLVKSGNLLMTAKLDSTDLYVYKHLKVVSSKVTGSKRSRSDYEAGVEDASFVAKAVKVSKKGRCLRGKPSDHDNENSGSYNTAPVSTLGQASLPTSVACMGLEATTANAINDLLLQHRLRGHFNFPALRKLLGLKSSTTKPPCHECNIAMLKGISMDKVTSKPRAEEILQRIHMDVGFGRNSELVYQLYIDDHSRRHFIDQLDTKAETLPRFKVLKKKMENDKAPLKVAFQRCDAESIYNSKAWIEFREEEGIEYEPNGPYRKESVIERGMQTVGNGARAFMLHGNAPEDDMMDALSHMVFCINGRPHSANPGRPTDYTPFESWHKQRLKPSKRMLQGVLFCLVYARIHPEQRYKDGDTSYPAVFLGCSHNSRAFKVRELSTGKKYFVSEGRWMPHVMPYRQNVPGALTTLDVDYGDFEPMRVISEGDDLAARERLSREREPSSKALDNIAALITSADPDPNSWEEALASEDALEWIEAGLVEKNNHLANKTWILVDESEAAGKKIFHPNFVFKRKWLPATMEYPGGVLDKLKVRMTIAAFKRMLIDGVDYREKYAATPKWNSTRIVFALTAHFDWELELNDVEAFFLAAWLEEGEEIFMHQAARYSDGSGRICKVQKSMYGLPQAAYHAQQKQIKNFALDGIKPTMSDMAIFVKKEPKKLAEYIGSTHVDDTLAAGTPAGLAIARKSLQRVFTIKNMPNPTLVLGVQVERSRKHKWLKLHQANYTLNLLNTYDMLDSKPTSTPLDKGVTKYLMPEQEGPDSNEDLHYRKHFQELYGKLIWLAPKTRPDLLFTVNYFSRMLRTAGKREFNLLRDRPLRYLNGTRAHGTVYQAGTSLSIGGGSDSDFAGDLKTSRSTMGTFTKLGKYGVITASSRLERPIMSSTGHAETVAAASWCKDAKWLRVMLREMGVAETGAAVCEVDNDGVIKQAIKSINHAAAKHYRVAQAYVRQLSDDNEVRLHKSWTEDNSSDMFTKALDKRLFQKHCRDIMGPQENPSKMGD